ncbi:hypothetical protein FOZ62_023481, partial [Perkinsus olseni]
MPFCLRAVKRVPRFKPNRATASLIPQASDVVSSSSSREPQQMLLPPPSELTAKDEEPSSEILLRDPTLKGIIESTRGKLEAIELFSASMLKNPFNTADSLSKIKEAALRQDPTKTYLQVAALERSLSASSNLDSQWGGQLIRRTLHQELNAAYAHVHGKYPDDPAAAVSVVTR